MTVIVFTKPNCPACTLTKKHLDGLGVAYETEPIDADVLEQARNAGITAAPIVLVEGRMLWGGYRPDALNSLA